MPPFHVLPQILKPSTHEQYYYYCYYSYYYYYCYCYYYYYYRISFLSVPYDSLPYLFKRFSLELSNPTNRIGFRVEVK